MFLLVKKFICLLVILIGFKVKVFFLFGISVVWLVIVGIGLIGFTELGLLGLFIIENRNLVIKGFGSI